MALQIKTRSRSSKIIWPSDWFNFIAPIKRHLLDKKLSKLGSIRSSLFWIRASEVGLLRIAALHGIQRFNKVLTLNDYEVEIVLFNLNEDNPRLREEIYLFFGETTVSQGALFTKILNKLFDNLQKFEHQEDTEKIFSLVQKLGKSHSKLVSSIYLKTLNIDKRYLAKEPDQTDIVYVAKMILIYAAAEQMPRILEEAPKFFGKHLNYLKDKYPMYFYRK